MSRCPSQTHHSSCAADVEPLECRLLLHAGHEHAEAALEGAEAAVIRVNAGGLAYVDSGGSTWSADQGFVRGKAVKSRFAVAGTEDDRLFSNRRQGVFSYAMPISSGLYVLSLAFVDTMKKSGKRLFNIDAEGQRIESNFDIAARVGRRSALVTSYEISITDGALNLAFTRVKGKAVVSAIFLSPAPVAQPAPEPAPVPEPVPEPEPVPTPQPPPEQPPAPTPPPVVTPPAAPSNLSADVHSAGEVLLAWTDASDNESGFNVERSLNGGAFAALVQLPAAATSHIDATVSPGNTYAYHVIAINAAGPSGPSNEQSVSITPVGPDPIPPFTQINWSNGAAAPLGKAEALRAVVDGMLYVFAGFVSTGPVARSDVYDPATDTWTRIADMPRRLTHAGVATEGRDVYFAGGYIGTGNGFQQQFGTTEVWRYDADTDTYTPMPALPAARAGGGLVALGRNLHYFSGNNSARQDVGDHYVLNLDNPGAGWSTLAPLPTPRSHMGYAAFAGRIYAIGGQTGNDASLTTTTQVHSYDPTTNAWTQRAAIPKAISHVSSATFVLGDRILIAGGETAHGEAIADVLAYDPAADSWQSLTPLPSRRFSGVAASIGTLILFSGGSSQTTTYRGSPVTE